MIRTTRRNVLTQIATHSPHPNVPIRLLIDLTPLDKTGKFRHLSHPNTDPDSPNRWVRMLNGRLRLHLVILFIVIGEWRVPWSFRIWRGKQESKLFATVPQPLVQGRTVIVQADTEFGTVDFLNAVRQRRWRAVVGMKNNRLLQDGHHLKDLPGHVKQGVQVYLKDIDYPLTVSWFWLKRAVHKRERRFVVSSHPYSGVYLIRLGRKRWAIEGFFKTVKHQFGLHCFGQRTKIGVYRWLILSLLTYLLAHWIDRWSWPPFWDWKATARLTLEKLFPSMLWVKLLRELKLNSHIAAQYGFEIIIRRPDNAYREGCKI